MLRLVRGFYYNLYFSVFRPRKLHKRYIIDSYPILQLVLKN